MVGNGFLLQQSIASVFTTISKRVEIDMPDMEHKVVEDTDLDSAWVTVVTTALKDGGELNLTINYDPKQATHASLWTSFTTHLLDAYKLKFTNASTVSELAFSAYLTKFKPGTAKVGDMVQGKITLRISGAATLTA